MQFHYLCLFNNSCSPNYTNEKNKVLERRTETKAGIADSLIKDPVNLVFEKMKGEYVC